MKVALVVSVAVTGGDRFAWQWRPEDGTGTLSDAFEYFFECCQDARKAGYECKVALDTRASKKAAKRAAGARRAART
ncbi:MAG TPA: hypothetical protein VHP37_22350 [Burkholderiales bacterium]|nr:hypothetical protein [Burkholderiales bacterium]